MEGRGRAWKVMEGGGRREVAHLRERRACREREEALAEAVGREEGVDIIRELLVDLLGAAADDEEDGVGDDCYITHTQ